MEFLGEDPEEWSWRTRAKCMGVDTDLFYPPRDRALYKGIADQAKAICWGTGDHDPPCPVRRQCLLYAVRMQDTHGIWGGLSHRERSHLVRTFRARRTTETFERWVMRSDGGAKARQFHAKVPRDPEG